MRLTLAASRTVHRADGCGSWCRDASAVAATMADGVTPDANRPGNVRLAGAAEATTAKWSSGFSQPGGLLGTAKSILDPQSSALPTELHEPKPAAGVEPATAEACQAECGMNAHGLKPDVFHRMRTD